MDKIALRVRYSPIKEEVKTYRQPSASLGEVEDYHNILISSPIKIKQVHIFDMGVDLDGNPATTNDIKEINNNKISYFEKVKYVVDVENLSDEAVNVQTIYLYSFMGNKYVENSLKYKYIENFTDEIKYTVGDDKNDKYIADTHGMNHEQITTKEGGYRPFRYIPKN